MGKPAPTPYTGPEVQDADTVERMRVAGRIAAQAMAEAAKLIAPPGVTTDELDRVAHEFMCDHGGLPVDAGLPRLPPQVAVHLAQRGDLPRIPDSTVLRDGDIVNLDVTAYINGGARRQQRHVPLR